MKKNSRRRDRNNESNRNSRIETRTTDSGLIRTETRYRDRGSLTASVTTYPSKRSQVFITQGGSDIVLSGREARTIYRVLQRHYDAVDSITPF